MALNLNQAVGVVESIDGLVTALYSDDTEAELTLSSLVYLNDQITTDESAAVSIRFTDKTSFSIGENSRVTIDEYIYDPGIAEGIVDISVLKGMFVFISGLVADENPQNMIINTPGTTIGIRGTEGGGKIGGAGESSYYFNADGIIEIITSAGSVTIDDTMEVVVVSPSGTLALATGWSAEQIIETFLSALRVAPLEVSQRIIDADGNLNVDAREYIERLVQQEADRDSDDGESDDQSESEDQGAGDGDAQEASGEESQSPLTDDTIVEAERSAVVLDISFGQDESQRQEYDPLAQSDEQQDDASELLNNSQDRLARAGDSANPELEQQKPEPTLDDTAPVFSSPATASVAENADITTVVYTAQASDNSGAAGITYTLGAAAAALFSIDAASGVVTLKAPADFETTPSYALEITATDAAGNAATQAVTVDITDVDDTAPVFSSPATASVAENADITTVVYTAQASDNSGAAGITYTLGAADAALFSIDAANGEVTLKAPADFETTPSYALDITATDAAGNAATQAVTVDITDVDDTAPTFVTSGDTTIFTFGEHKATDVVLGTVQATDDVAVAVFNFVHDSGTRSTTSEDGNLMFRLNDNNNGEIYLTRDGTISAVNDFESVGNNVFPYTVEVEDTSGNVSATTLQFSTSVDNELAPYFVDVYGAPVVLPTASAPTVSLPGAEAAYSAVFTFPVYVADELNGIFGQQDSSGEFVYSAASGPLTRMQNTGLQAGGGLNDWDFTSFTFGASDSGLIFRFGDGGNFMVPGTDWVVTNPDYLTNVLMPIDGTVSDNSNNIVATLEASPGTLIIDFSGSTDADTDDVSALLQSLHFGLTGVAPTGIAIMVNDGDFDNPASNDADHTQAYSVAVV